MFNPRKGLLFIGFLLFLVTRADAEDYAARFKQLKEKKAAGTEIDALLTQWRTEKSDDPDAWITSANYYFNQSVGPTISTKKPEKGEFGLTDKKTGKEAGSISFKPNVSEGFKQATDLLREATTKFPERLDIWCGLTWMYQEAGDFDNELATLKKMVAYTRQHPTGLKWLNGKPIEQPETEFVPEKLHGYGLYYETKENPEDDKRWFQISTLAIEQYPNRAEGFNDAAGYYADLADWKKARELFEKAHALDPKSPGPLINLGNVCVEMKDFAAARKCFEEAIKLDPDGQFASEAKKELAKLKKK